MADHSDSSPLIPPSPITEHSEIDLEEQIQCRICLKTDGGDFIAPCKCKGTSKYVHRECLDHWRAVREGFAFSHCTTCKTPYHLRVHLVADRKWQTLKFRFFVTRDIIFIFLAVQLVIASLAYLVYLIDDYQQFWLRLAWGFDSELSFYYICGALLFFALLGLSGCFITCYDQRVRNDSAQPCRELCLCCCQPGPKIMNTPSAQFVPSRGIGVHEHIHQIGMRGENFKSIGNLNISASLIVEDTKLDNLSEDTSHGTVEPSNQYDQEATNPADKAYVQQLETSRLKLIQLEQELEQARQHGLYLGGGLDASHLGFSGTVNSGIAAFEMEYGHWVEEQTRQTCELRSTLNAHISDIELQNVVDSGMNHYTEFFRLKATATKADVFYVMSGMWKTSAERFFLWIGGFRPSELLKVLVPHLDPLADQQIMEVYYLQLSCQQAEDALTQGMDKIQQTLAETVASGQLVEGTCIPQMGTAMEKLEALVRFVNQADHLRQETLQQMSRILTTRQAARGLLALGEYCQRLRALSSLWATRPRQSA